MSLEGSGLANNTRGWAAGDFRGMNLPTSLDGVSVMINNRPAFVEYISPTLVNVITPVDPATGPVSVQLTNNGSVSNSVTVQKAQFAPAFILYNSDKYIVALHSDNTLVGPTTLYPGASTPAKAGETIVPVCIRIRTHQSGICKWTASEWSSQDGNSTYLADRRSERHRSELRRLDLRR